MGKKQKKNLQKILAKRQQLQQLGATNTLEQLPEPATPQRALEGDKPVAALEAPSHKRELLRTLVSIAIITVLFVGVVLYDRQRNDLQDLGNWLYSELRLNAK